MPYKKGSMPSIPMDAYLKHVQSNNKVPSSISNTCLSEPLTVLDTTTLSQLLVIHMSTITKTILSSYPFTIPSPRRRHHRHLSHPTHIFVSLSESLLAGSRGGRVVQWCGYQLYHSG